MEDTLITTVQTIGLPVALILYYLIMERPRQEKNKEIETKRHDALVDKIINAQVDCANKMNEALRDHTDVIKDLTDMIQKLETKIR
jgi:hypothetical protein